MHHIYYWGAPLKLTSTAKTHFSNVASRQRRWGAPPRTREEVRRMVIAKTEQTIPALQTTKIG
jgi:hypothetical protein